MTRLSILFEGTGVDEATYRAVTGSAQAARETAGEAVDTLAASHPEDEGGTLLIVRDHRPDRSFAAE